MSYASEKDCEISHDVLRASSLCISSHPTLLASLISMRGRNSISRFLILNFSRSLTWRLQNPATSSMWILSRFHAMVDHTLTRTRFSNFQPVTTDGRVVSITFPTSCLIRTPIGPTIALIDSNCGNRCWFIDSLNL